MDGTDQKAQPWSSVQTYAMAVLCLLIGMPVGYLLGGHGPARADAGHPQSERVPQEMSASVMPPALQARGEQPGEQRLEPLLAQLKQNPTDAQLLAKIGSVYLSAQQFPTAKNYFERSLAVKEDPFASSGLAFAVYNMGNTDEAIRILTHALKAEPNNPILLFNVGVLEWRGKTDPQAAIAAWEKLLRTNPNYRDRATVEKMLATARTHMNVSAEAPTK